MDTWLTLTGSSYTERREREKKRFKRRCCAELCVNRLVYVIREVGLVNHREAGVNLLMLLPEEHWEN